jgi:hypothetical protein
LKLVAEFAVEVASTVDNTVAQLVLVAIALLPAASSAYICVVGIVTRLRTRRDNNDT